MSKTFDYDTSNIPAIYSEARQLPRETLNLWLQTIQNIIKIPINTILDLGCGEGRFSLSLATTFHATVYGIDPSQKMLSLARQRDHAMSQVKYLPGFGEHIPLSDGKISMVFMSMVLHHLEDIDKTIAEITRVLSSSGYLVIRNVTKEDINQIDFLNFFPAAKQIDIQRMLPEADIIRQFTDKGFQLISSRIMEQILAHDYHEYYDKLSQRGLSALALISDQEFNIGLKRLKRYCEQQPRNEKVYEKIHLFIFQK